MNHVVILKDSHYEEIPFLKKIEYKGQLLEKSEQGFAYAGETINAYELNEVENEQFLVMSEQSLYIKRKPVVTVANKLADITISDFDVQIYFEKDTYHFSGDMYHVYHNGNLAKEEGTFTNGDIFQIKNIRFTLFDDYIEVQGNRNTIETILPIVENVQKRFDTFPNYNRSPRIIKKVNEEDIKIAKPPQKAELNTKGVLATFVPTLLMAVATVGVGFFMGRGIMLITMVLSSVVTLVTNVSKFFSDKKETKEKNIKREEVYSKYLLSLRKRTFHQYNDAKEALHYHNPSVNEISTMINEYSSRLYERNANDEDFLTICIGRSSEQAPFSILLDRSEIEMEEDELLNEAQSICDEYSNMRDKPVVIDLKQAHLGLIGDKRNIHEQLKVYFSQLTFLQSYHDLEIIYLYSEENRETFNYLKWYPHFKVKAINTLGCIYNERMRDQVLGSVYQMLKDRKLKEEENKKETRFLPHLLFVIDEPSLVLNHSIMEMLQLEMNTLGYSIIYTTSQKSKLPENIKTVVSIENRDQGILVMENQELMNKKFRLDHTKNVDLEKEARILAAIEHQEKISSQIPESIGFFELFKVESPEQFRVKEKWNQNAAFKSLAVPLGVRAVDDIVMLDLHEKAHGPHGLVAGTTGSGKSEIVQSYILSLALHFHPHEVGFLLIDYKGGGMANLFKDLPHQLGTITNLDGSESMRALVSIQSELKRRQRIFGDHDVNNINAYHKLFKSGKAEEPLPHLFIISDEFAELKKEQPEFMKELVSTARIGRSLGVHLILATQKPTGVVDDQIWTNSKFKLCLKVQNESDSKEMLKTPDAANITQPGRSYLQVGNNEIYELFQSAYSGAAFVSGGEEKSFVDNRIYLLNELGQGQLINEDLSEQDEKIEVKKSELDVTIDYISKEYESLHAVEVKKPWLPSLKQKLVNPAIGKVCDVCTYPDLDLNLHVGMMDIPEEQRQSEYIIDLEKEGNITFVSASGFGKSIALANMLLNLAMQNSVDNLNYYILDFGNSALINYRELPHTADYITMDDEERLNKFMKLIEDEIKKRKKLLSEKAAQNFNVYNQLSDQKLQAIVVAVDNFDVVKEISDDMKNFFVKLTREGMSLGIYLAMSVSRFGSIHYTMTNYMKVRVVGYLFDKSEYSPIIGSIKDVLPEIKGRAYIKSDGIHMIQQYIPFDFSDDVDLLNKSRSLVKEIAESNSGSKAQGIAVLPEKLVYSDLNSYQKHKRDIYLGLCCQDVIMEGIETTQNPFLILGSKGSGKTNAIKVILNQAKENGKVTLFDSNKMELFAYGKHENVTYLEQSSEFKSHEEQLRNTIEKRMEVLREATKRGENRIDVLNGFENLYIIVHELDDYIKFVSPSPDFVSLIRDAVEVHIHFIVASESTKFKGIDKMITYFKEVNNGLGLVNMGEVSTGMRLSFRDKLPEFKKAMYFSDGSHKPITMLWDEKSES